MQPTEITGKSWAMVATLGLIWGATFLGVELALEGITPFWLAAGRIGFAAVLMAVIQRLRNRPLLEEIDAAFPWTPLLVIGALSTAVPFALLSWGQQYVTSGFAGISMAAVALMVLPLAHFMIPGEQLSVRRSIGFTIGFVGVAILIGSQAFESSGSSLEIFGRLACLSAAACYALSSVMVRRLPAIDPIGLASLVLYVGAAIAIPLAFFVEGIPPIPSAKILIIMVIIGMLPTAGANVLRVLVIRSAGPTFMSLTNYQVPVWSVFLGWVFLAEPLPATLLLALALILSGVFVSQWGALRRMVKSPV